MSHADAARHQQDAAGHQADDRIAQADRRIRSTRHDERRRDRVRVADAQRDAVDHHEQEHQHAARTARRPTGWSQQQRRRPATSAAPQNDDPHDEAAGAEPPPARRGGCWRAGLRAHAPARASTPISARSTSAAPMIIAERDEEADLAERVARPRASRSPRSTASAAQPMHAHHDAGTPMRDPTIMPAPNVEAEQLDRAEQRDLAPRATPPTDAERRCRRRAGRSIARAAAGRSARAGCWRRRGPTGTSSCSRSTRIGV